MRILAEDTIAIGIDMQDRLMPAILDSQTVIDNSVTLLKGFKILNIPFIITEQYSKGLLQTVSQLHQVAGDYAPFEKITFSGYENEAIRRRIESSGRKNIILFGAEAHVCVLQTLIDLREADYQVILVSDCIGSRKEKDKQAAIERAVFEGAIVTTYEQILFELTRKAGTPVFKEMISLVK